ncbi:TonB-dependent siderophore receptor [Comamonas terrigena]|uniref:TonB-dependent siderophore receptor n=1 Tax=Comamonas terrigena TaxID=32013 RepID=UPI00244A5842|nr:TonB-dependent siderophore receptor [Comamonas terrigena]MDH0050632.1 TonB-dependent receptor [Comamonas terrigena]MDH0513032.1 TonB-dependent receptor [Comamonas terrigena]MDH1092491.1 TonB-dependent receptor [Comamonas terrigena]MDH1502588.1 TonB-dependent receptor [Comamonas terrigena]
MNRRPLHPQPTATARATQLLCASLIACATALPALPALAQTSTAQAQRSYTIPAGTLASALNRLGRESGALISFAPDLVAGLQTSGAQGTQGVAQSLAALLAGTGLEAVPDASGAYALRRIPEAAQRSSGGAATLAEVKVTAAATVADGTTEGTGRYTAAGPSGAATGLALTLRETPQSVTVFTRQRMEDFKLQTLTDVMEQTPGLTVSRQNQMVTYNVRGSTANLQVDGSRQLSSGWGFNTHTLYTMDDLADIDRVEVLKGSSGLMNGDGNYGATINLIRKRPTKEFQAHVEAGAGSWDSYRADADIAGPLNAEGSLRGRLVLSEKRARGFRDYEDSSGRMVYGTLEYDLSPDTLLSAGVTYRERSLHGSGATTPLQAYSGTGAFVGWMPRSYNNGARWAGYDQKGLNLFTRLEHNFGQGWKAKLQLVHEEIDVPEQLLGYMNNALPGAVNFGRYGENTTRNQSIQVDVQGPFSLFGRQHDLLLGAGASKSRINLQRGGGDNTTLGALGLDYAQGGGALPNVNLSGLTYSDDLFSRKRNYVYAAGRFSLADPVKLIVGARATNYDQKDVSDVSWYNYDLHERGVVTPYAGVVVDVARDVSLYASYASIFQAQSAKNASEQTLPPEEGKTYEIGAKGEFFDKRLNASAAYFWMKTDNTAETVGQTPAGETISRAVSGVTRRGWELELSGELARGWQLQGGFVMNSSTLDSSSTTPKYQFKLGTTYQFRDSALQGLTVGAATRWQSDISTSRGATTLRQDAYWLVDLMARYQVDRHWSVAANVNNALDKRYFAGVTNFNAQGLFYTWGAPRSLNLSARYDF